LAEREIALPPELHRLTHPIVRLDRLNQKVGNVGV
jgi:hypothetical protein